MLMIVQPFQGISKFRESQRGNAPHSPLDFRAAEGISNATNISGIEKGVSACSQYEWNVAKK